MGSTAAGQGAVGEMVCDSGCFMVLVIMFVRFNKVTGRGGCVGRVVCWQDVTKVGECVGGWVTGYGSGGCWFRFEVGW